MDGKLEHRSRAIVAGLSFYGNPFAQSAGWTEENEIGRLWGRFMRLREDDPGGFPPPAEPNVMFELHLPDSRTAETGEYEVFIGYPVAGAGDLPLALAAKVIPAGRFVRFTLVGAAITDKDSYQEMYDWIGSNDLEPLSDWAINIYDVRFKGMERIAESELDVCVPVRDPQDAD